MTNLEKNAARYEFVRRMTPQQFQSLWQENIKTGRHFDDLVDEAMTQSADQSDKTK